MCLKGKVQRGTFIDLSLCIQCFSFVNHIQPWTPEAGFIILYYRWKNEAHITLLLSHRARIQSFRWGRYHAYVHYNFPAKRCILHKHLEMCTLHKDITSSKQLKHKTRNLLLQSSRRFYHLKCFVYYPRAYFFMIFLMSYELPGRKAIRGNVPK